MRIKCICIRICWLITKVDETSINNQSIFMNREVE